MKMLGSSHEPEVRQPKLPICDTLDILWMQITQAYVLDPHILPTTLGSIVLAKSVCMSRGPRDIFLLKLSPGRVTRVLPY